MNLTAAPVWIIMVINIFFNILGSFSRTYYIRKAISKNSDYYLFIGVYGLFVTLIMLVLSGFQLETSLYSFIVGVIFGIITFLSSVVGAIAVKTGPISYTQVIVNMSTLITAFSGFLFWNESLDVFIIIGICLMLLCFFLSVDTSKDGNKKASVKWFIFTLLTMIFSAALGLTQKIHQMSPQKEELFFMLIVSFASGTLFSFLMWPLVRKSELKMARITDTKEQYKEVPETKKPKFSLKFLLICCFILGIGVAVNNVLGTYLTGVIDTAIYFPISSGTLLIAMILLSFLFYKERLKAKQLVGLCLGIAATVCLCI